MAKNFQLSLNYGPYLHDFTRNGRYLALGGSKGHLSLIDLIKLNKISEFSTGGRKVNDLSFLFDESLFAVSERDSICIYDKQGIEVHYLEDQKDIYKLKFMPYHFLLTSIGRQGVLRYFDVSLGKLISKIKTRQGPCRVIENDPTNAIINLGHTNGTVSLWSPNSQEVLTKIYCHKGPVNSISIDLSGKYLITSGFDSKINIFDTRNYKKIKTIPKRVSKFNSVDLSQKNVLAVGEGSKISLWDKVFDNLESKATKIIEHSGTEINRIKFRPFEDILGISLFKGFQSLIVPGSGELNFDSFEVNPFESKKEKQNRLVRGLLEKIQPEFIVPRQDLIGTIFNENKNENKKENKNENKINKIKSIKNHKNKQKEFDKSIREKIKTLKKNKNKKDIKLKNKINNNNVIDQVLERYFGKKI